MDRDDALKQLMNHLSRAQGRMKTQTYKNQTDSNFDIGKCPKLSARYYGPFEILERIGEVAYCLKLPPSSRIHSVFHVSLLKKAMGN